MSDMGKGLLNGVGRQFWRSRMVRRAAFGAMLAALAVFSAYEIGEIVPHEYQFRISGGDILGNAHLVARALAENTDAVGVSLQIVPTESGLTALDMVDEGNLDFALVSASAQFDRPNVVHVATVAPELAHLMVRKGIDGAGDLRGHTINLGPKNSSSYRIGRELIDFADYLAGRDFVETNYSSEQLLQMPGQDLPDVLLLSSFVPYFVADFLVDHRDYRLVELPFADAMSKRNAWIADGVLPAFIYSVRPPVPPRDYKTVGAYLQLVANKNVEARAVKAVSEVLYGPSVAAKLLIQFDPSKIALAANYPLSKATEDYLHRNDPWFSGDLAARIRHGGLLLVAALLLIAIARWWYGWETRRPVEYVEAASGMTRLMALDTEVQMAIAAKGGLSPAEINNFLAHLSSIKADALRAGSRGAGGFQGLLAALADSRVLILAAHQVDDPTKRPSGVGRRFMSFFSDEP